MRNSKSIFHGNVGQHIEGGKLKSVRTRITMDADGNMIVDTDIEAADEQEEER